MNGLVQFLLVFFAADLTPLPREQVRIAEGDRESLVLGVESSPPVVFEDSPRARFAADYLAAVLRDATGVAPEVYRLPDGVTNSFSRAIFVPKGTEGDGFSTVVSPSGVTFGGRTDYAVFDFCERVLGVRQYWDGPGGRSVPKRGPIEVPRMTYSDSPVFALRNHSSQQRAIWYRVAKGGGGHPSEVRCHTTDAGWCYGDPERIREYCRRVDEDIAGGERFGRVVDRVRKTVSVSPWDVAYECPCRWCRTLRSEVRPINETASPVLWDRFLPRLAAHLAEKHPDYRIGVLPYWNYVAAPKPGAVAATNVFAEVCAVSGLARFSSERLARMEERHILDWERTTGRPVALWHYSCWPAESTKANYVYGRTIAAHYRRMRGHITGSFICGARDDFPRFAISQYVWMRCLWNPEIDVDAVYDEFCRRQFGAAAAPMRRLLELQETAWNPETLVFAKETAAEMRALLEESARLVRGTPAAAAFRYYTEPFYSVPSQDSDTKLISP